MLRIRCPFCGVRDHAEFTFEGPADVAWPALDAAREAWVAAVHERDNPKGPSRELWRHALGCGAFVVVERDTLTHAISGTELAHPGWRA